MPRKCTRCGEKEGFFDADLFGSYDKPYICASCTSLIEKERTKRVQSAQNAIKTIMVSTAFEIPGYQVTRHIGIVRGIVVRSRSVLGTLGASVQTIVGGDITLFTQLCEQARADAFQRMLTEAALLEANAVIGMRYDATELAPGVSEVLAYGTAVIAENKES